MVSRWTYNREKVASIHTNTGETIQVEEEYILGQIIFFNKNNKKVEVARKLQLEWAALGKLN